MSQIGGWGGILCGRNSKMSSITAWPLFLLFFSETGVICETKGMRLAERKPNRYLAWTRGWRPIYGGLITSVQGLATWAGHIRSAEREVRYGSSRGARQLADLTTPTLERTCGSDDRFMGPAKRRVRKRRTVGSVQPQRHSSKRERKRKNIVAVDLFCGAGGLTRGLLDAGIQVVAGYDTDEACRFPYVHNNAPVEFTKRSVSSIKGEELLKLYPSGSWRVLVGCAPCQPFSKYTQGFEPACDEKWGLLRHFGRLVRHAKPHVVSMENVPELQRHGIFHEFVKRLEALGFAVSFSVIFCPDYGIPQQRSRLVLFASRLGRIEMMARTHTVNRYPTVRAAIGHLPKLAAGKTSPEDALHRTSRLSPLNLQRMQASRPGGTWRDWDEELRAKCHRKRKGKTYPSVYGRMEWDMVAPTITTQFYGFGNGRFGHPEQDRAISLREGAVLQTFSDDYRFVEEGGKYHIKTIGRLIGNAVPVRLGEVIGKTIKSHLSDHEER